jgi:MSHA biogenesis protein MshN
MSLINQMLKDLEQRKAAGSGQQEQWPGTVQIVDEPPAAKRFGWPIAAGVVLVVAAVSGAWWYFGKSRMQTPPAIPVAAMKPPVIPISPDNKSPSTPQPQTAAEPGRPAEPAAAVPAMPPVTSTVSPPAPSTKVTPTAQKTIVPTKPRRQKNRKHRRPVYDQSVESMQTGANGESADQHYRRALRLQESGQDGAAREELEAAIRQAPEHAEARKLLAKSYAVSGQYQRADELLQNSRGDGEAAALRAQIYLKQGKTEQAEQAIDASPADGQPERMAVKAAIKQKQGRYGEAADYYGKAIKVQPSQSKWWLGLAISLEGSERHQEAIQAYQRVLETGAPSREVQRYVESRLSALRGNH